MNIILISYKTNMRVNYLLLLALLAFTTCEYSGLKAAITSDFFKILTKFNFEKYIQNMKQLNMKIIPKIHSKYDTYRYS